MIGEDRMIHFSGCALNEACTIVLRGASECGEGGLLRGWAVGWGMHGAMAVVVRMHLL